MLTLLWPYTHCTWGELLLKCQADTLHEDLITRANLIFVCLLLLSCMNCWQKQHPDNVKTHDRRSPFWKPWIFNTHFAAATQTRARLAIPFTGLLRALMCEPSALSKGFSRHMTSCCVVHSIGIPRRAFWLLHIPFISTSFFLLLSLQNTAGTWWFQL